MTVRIARIADERLDIAAHIAAVEDAGAGAVASFIGTVRDHDPDAPGGVVALEYSAHPDADGVNPATLYSEDGRISHVPPEAAVAYFFNDAAPEDAWAAARRLTPQGEGGRAVVMRVTPERFGLVPRLYVEALDDRSVIPAVQRLMLRLSPGARGLAEHGARAAVHRARKTRRGDIAFPEGVAAWRERLASPVAVLQPPHFENEALSFPKVVRARDG